MMLAGSTGLKDLADELLTVPKSFGANAGLKVLALVAGMVAGADSIDDMAILRHGGMKKLFTGTYAPSTLGSFLRAITFGHVRQLDATARRWLNNLAAVAPIVAGIDDYALVDIDDTIKEVHGYQKQGAGFGYSHVRGLNALIGIVSTATAAPIIVGSRLRRGPTNSVRGRGREVRLRHPRDSEPVAVDDRDRTRAPARRQRLLRPLGCGRRTSRRGEGVHHRADGFCGQTHPPPSPIPRGPRSSTPPRSSTKAQGSGSRSRKSLRSPSPRSCPRRKKKADRIHGRLIVRRIRELNAFAGDGQPTLFDTHRFHAFFTTSDLDPVTADKTHRQHAVIEQINADLKDSALGHFPSGVFSANAAWLVLATITFNLSRAIGTLTGTDLGKARTATIRRKLIQIPARISTTARKVVLHLPKHWPWETGWTSLHAATCSPPRTASP